VRTAGRRDAGAGVGLRRVPASATLRSGRRSGLGQAVEIGEPERTYTVEPLEDPVPREPAAEPAQPTPAEEPIEPERVQTD
jgi:hypothetical protein